ncbi:hypothetical protein [Nostoc commune]|uniref:hypothetical protein n=1 Tax=Nostoc commune TaxID=1178 RepID=UPI0018C7345F|nr:hypothetical protein [Nostoc commune]
MSDCRAENTEREEIERIFTSVLGYFFIWKSVNLHQDYRKDEYLCGSSKLMPI